MTGLTAILRKEVKNFVNGGWGFFLINALIAVVWSFMLLFQHMLEIGSGGTGLWMVFFAVIVAANFSGTVFISERVNGTLEVLIVSGVTRDAVLFGKVFFVAGATIAMGVVCLAITSAWVFLINVLEGDMAGLRNFAVWACRISPMYVGAVVMNVSASAYLSVRMGNPRFLHFANLFMTGAIMAVYGLIMVVLNEQYRTALVLVFLALGALFLVLARREFAGERITRPVIF
jgi:ABC-type Na+ efflux pump permease subunit